MRLLKLIRRPFRARRLRRNRPPKALSLQDEAEAAWAEAEELQRRSAQSRKKTAGRRSTYSSGKRSFIRQM